MPRLAEELGKSGPFESREQEAYLNLIRASAVLSNGFHRLFRSYELSESSYNTLRIIRGHGAGGCRAADISRQLVVPVPDVTRLVDRLVEHGLATRSRSPEDGRAVTLKLTAKGRGLLKRLDGPVLALHREQLGHLSAGELDTLNGLLDRVRGGGDSAGS